MNWKSKYQRSLSIPISRGQICLFHKMYDFPHEIDFEAAEEYREKDQGYFLAYIDEDYFVPFQEIQYLSELALELGVDMATVVTDSVVDFSWIVSREIARGTLLTNESYDALLTDGSGIDLKAEAPRVEATILKFSVFDGNTNTVTRVQCDVNNWKYIVTPA